MQEFSLQLSKIVGTSTEEGWSQIHVFNPNEPEKIASRGQLLAVISLKDAAPESEIVAFGRELISRLHEEYYGQLSDGPLTRLKETLAKIATEVKTGAVVEIAAAAVVGKVLYTAIGGRGKLVLCRNGKTATILSGSGSASGYLQPEDLFLLGTGRIFEVAKKEELRAVLATGNPEEIAEALNSYVHSREGGEMIGALIVKAAIEKLKGRGKTKQIGGIETPEKKKERLAGLGLMGFAAKINSWLFRRRERARKKPIFLEQKRERNQRSRKSIISIALILLVILGVSVVLGRQQRRRIGKERQIETILKEARAKKEEGEALLEINPLRARELLQEAQEMTRGISPEDLSNQALVEFQKELEAVLPRVFREHEVEPKMYFDLELIKEGAKGDSWDYSAGRLFIFDQEKTAVYSLGISDQKSMIVAGGSKVEGGRRIAVSSEIYILTDRGIFQANKETEDQGLVITADEKWEGIVDFCAFGGNLYLLDKRGEIWQYPGTEEGFGTAKAWIKETKPDFSDAVSMAIDGAIWVLKADGAIKKYIQGRQDVFGLAGLDKPLSAPAVIYTDPDQEKLYVLDGVNLRVVVFSKSGEYDSQYLWPGMKNVGSIVALEKEKKILLMEGSKIWEIEMK